MKALSDTLITAAALSSALALSTTAYAANNSLTTYQQQAKTLLEMLENQSQGIEAASEKLVSDSLPIVDAFIVKYPECTEYLTALKQAAEKIPTLPLAEIESGYHADGQLPELKNAQCYHAKDLLVHPATVQAMAKIGINTEQDWESAEHEIEEVIEHFSQVQAAMK